MDGGFSSKTDASEDLVWDVRTVFGRVIAVAERMEIVIENLWVGSANDVTLHLTTRV